MEVEDDLDRLLEIENDQLQDDAIQESQSVSVWMKKNPWRNERIICLVHLQKAKVLLVN